MEQRQLQQRTKFDLHALVEAAIMVALATVLSVIVVYRAPQGGSVTPASMLPLMVLAFRRGPYVGFFAGVVYGFIQFWINPYIYHWAQVILDYPLAFAVLGLAGFFRRWPYVGMVVAIAARMLSHVLSGVIFFASFAPAGTSPWVYSTAYNASYLLPELVLSLVVFALLNGATRGELLTRVS